MEIIILVAIVMTICFGFVPLIAEILFKSKDLREKLLEDERREIIDAIMNFRPLAASPDVRDTKHGIIDVITRRSL